MSNLIDRAKAFYNQALTEPVDACEEYLSNEFVLENYLPENIPFGGRYEGASGFLQYLGEIESAIEMGPLKMDAWMADANNVAVRGTERSLVKSTDRKYQMRFVHWLTFDSRGRITNMREYNDTAEMAKAFDLETN
jgi:ketosteroid isomerase-like protein